MKIQILRLLGINNDKPLHTTFVMQNQQRVYILKTRPTQLSNRMSYKHASNRRNKIIP